MALEQGVDKGKKNEYGYVRLRTVNMVRLYG